MLLIVAHHYVVNSGLVNILKETEFTPTSSAMLLFGAWGKTGINCFIMITGYFMCKSQITGKKLLKLYLQITFYAVIIFGIFYLTGHENLTPTRIIRIFLPVKSVTDGFISCFMVFYLLIPFLNILIRNIDKRKHQLLLLLLLTVYSLMPTLRFPVTSNYVTWFCVLYLIASYIRFYGLGKRFNHTAWGWIALSSIIAGSVSVLGLYALHSAGHIKMTDFYYFLSDSNKILSVFVAVSTFMWFKDMRIPHSKIINAIGASTFGVLLIHANSDAMRQWLWRETIDCAGHYNDSVLSTVSYATISVALIFTICAGIEWLRIKTIEPYILDFSGTFLKRCGLNKAEQICTGK